MNETEQAPPDWLTAFADPPTPATLANVDLVTDASELAPATAQTAELKVIEARLFAKSLRVTEAMMAFMDIDLEDLDGSKAKFVAEYGEEEGLARFRVALSSWQSAKHAPVGPKYCKDVTLGILKAKNQAPPTVAHLNMTFVQMTAPPPEHLAIMDAITVDE